MNGVALRRKILGVHRRIRQARLFAKAMQSSRHPVLAHVIPTRRCNLCCAYCNEYDRHSPPVPAAEMLRRIDRLAELGTAIITFSGGEPLLHPDLDELIRRVRQHGIFATVITNGYLLSPRRIERLNRAGLDQLQVSIDNVLPDEVSKKSLKVIEKRLQWLARYAEFDVSINSVIGAPVRNPADALVVARRAVQLGFAVTAGILHDDCGQLVPLSEQQHAVFNEMVNLQKPFFGYGRQDPFQQKLARGLPNNWHCRAGCRYLYVCENGLVHYCSQERGFPGIPLMEYSTEHLNRAYETVKPCAPYCTISCVQRVAMLDQLREAPLEAILNLLQPPLGQQSPREPPVLLRMLTWMFLTGAGRQLFRKAALRVLGVK